MSKRIIVATFDREEDLFSGVKNVREKGLTVVDAYTPYAVHGLDRALGLKPSRLAWACGVFGLSAAIFMTWFQHWTSAVSWPINIGGKPWNSLPAFAPVIFEAMVLCAGLGTVLVFFIVARLRPGKVAKPVVEGVTDDRFALVIEHADANFNPEELRCLLADCNASSVDERAPDEAAVVRDDGADDRSKWLGRINVALLATLVVLVALNLFAPRKPSQPNWEIFSEMVHSPASDALSANSELPGGMTLQQPVPETIAQGHPPLQFEPADLGPEPNYEPPGRVKPENPFSAEDFGAVPRGEQIFKSYCVTCHGGGGAGDGPVVLRGYRAPRRSLAVGESRNWSDGQLFHVITYGRENMSSPTGPAVPSDRASQYNDRDMPSHAGLVSRADRWKVILYIRELQAMATPAEADNPAEDDPAAQDPATDEAATKDRAAEESTTDEPVSEELGEPGP